MNILVTVYPFGTCGNKPIDLLRDTGWNVIFNPLDRRLKDSEVMDMLRGVDAVIAGTETYDRNTIQYAKYLKVISRSGIGLDSIDYEACKEKNIIVANTPDAPSDAVADLTIAQIFNLLRGIHISNKAIERGEWKRITGLSIKQIKIGILGVGRIGRRVIDRLKPFDANILACDINDDIDVDGVTWVDKDTMFRECDLVSVHIPLGKKNHHCVGINELKMMKKGSYIINTSRGSVLDEKALESCLADNYLGGAALDVFETEPYIGIMQEMDNVILTAHHASSDRLAKYLMELGAVENCIKILEGGKPENITEDIDYE